MQERRVRYREQQGLEAIRVSIALLDGEYTEVSLIDASSHGVAVAVDAGAAELPGLTVGTKLYLSFEIGGSDPIRDVLAVIRNERGDSESLILGLEILDWKKLHSYLPSRLLSTFNRRRYYRVDVPSQPETVVAVSIEQSDRAANASLSNISAGGCLLVFRPEELPDAGETVRITFRLPDSAYQFELLGAVKSTWERDGVMQCGVEFEPARSREFVTQQQHISQYVMKRQRELRGGR